MKLLDNNTNIHRNIRSFTRAIIKMLQTSWSLLTVLVLFLNDFFVKSLVLKSKERGGSVPMSAYVYVYALDRVKSVS